MVFYHSKIYSGYVCLEARDAVFNRYPLYFLRQVLSLNLNSAVQLSWLTRVLQGSVSLSPYPVSGL